jgi:hypothetical protein
MVDDAVTLAVNALLEAVESSRVDGHVGGTDPDRLKAAVAGFLKQYGEFREDVGKLSAVMGRLIGVVEDLQHRVAELERRHTDDGTD